jgi:hypothetical protein
MATLHHTFIESIAIFPNEAMSFNSINKLIEAKTKDYFLLFEEHLFASVLVHRKSYDVQFDDLLNEDLEFFS